MIVSKKQALRIKFYSIVIGVLITGGLGIYTPSSAISQETRTSTKSKRQFVVDYKDYNNILKGIVLNKGAPSRTAPPNIAPPTGTRISFVSKKITRLESNRVMFHYLKKDDKKTVHTARLDLEALPTSYPLENFSKNEQLAYWLNLRNLTVLDMVARNYPLMKLDKFWTELENDKTLNVAGTFMSINDIETLITTNWPRTDVIYGFYNGSIGGPNIRTKAFTGNSVWANLDENAKEFTNSLRGIQFRKNTTKVSDYYKRHSTFFPNFDYDLRNHLLTHLNKNLALKLQKTTVLKVTINDWYVADLMGGKLGLSSAGHIQPGGSPEMIRRDIALQRFPAHVRAYLTGRQKRILERQGTVTIDEVYGTEHDVPVSNDDKKKN